jgi:TnpA family transposase
LSTNVDYQAMDIGTALQRRASLKPPAEGGWNERTLFMLDWLESPQLRQLCHAGLNKSEQRHALAQVICTFKQGRIADRGPDAQQFRASGLNLVIAAIVH